MSLADKDLLSLAQPTITIRTFKPKFGALCIIFLISIKYYQ